LLPIAIDGHIEGIYGLSLFAEYGYDVDAAASADAHQQHLHGAYAEVLSAGFGVAVHADGMTRLIPGFETEIPADPLQLNPSHFGFFCKGKAPKCLFCTEIEPG
jgi:hypothetical protein